MVKWDIPNGVLGYEKTGFRATEQGCRGGVLGCRGQRNGGYEASLHAPNWVKQEKKPILFAIFRAWKMASSSGIKHETNTLKTLYFAII